MTQKKTFVIVAIAAVALGAVVVGAWYFLSSKKEAPAATASADATKKERKVLYWTDPMIPGFKSDKPGKSPMNMDMVPVYEDEAAVGGEPIVTVRPEIIQNLGVRTYTVTRGSQPRRVLATGYLFRDVQGSASVAGGRTPGATDARGLAVLADLIDRDASLVRAGQRVEVRVADVPERTWGGVVEEVESDVDIGARTVKARIRLNQTSAALQPNMFAEVAILGAASVKSALFIPREALIRTGSRNAVVLALGEGRFQPMAVTPGAESDDWIEIRHGIKEGDVVVTSGQFLIDSEASVRASFSRMQSAEPGLPGAPTDPKATIPAPAGANPHAGH